jgi:hypothetical protein
MAVVCDRVPVGRALIGSGLLVYCSRYLFRLSMHGRRQGVREERNKRYEWK